MQVVCIQSLASFASSAGCVSIQRWFVLHNGDDHVVTSNSGGGYMALELFLFLQEQIKGIIIVDVTDLAGRSRSKQPVLRQLRFVRQRLAQPSAWRIGFELPQFSAV